MFCQHRLLDPGRGRGCDVRDVSLTLTSCVQVPGRNAASKNVQTRILMTQRQIKVKSIASVLRYLHGRSFSQLRHLVPYACRSVQRVREVLSNTNLCNRTAVVGLDLSAFRSIHCPDEGAVCRVHMLLEHLYVRKDGLGYGRRVGLRQRNEIQSWFRTCRPTNVLDYVLSVAGLRSWAPKAVHCVFCRIS